jgi:glycosyltransferase involved in cell wall biosynthesis
MVLYLGRLDPRKGIELGIQAFAQDRFRDLDTVFVVAGPGNDRYKASLVELAEALGVGERLRFTGFVDGETRQSALSDADVLILTSHSENFGMSVVEGMAVGTPVLISDRVGIAREVASAAAGVVTPLDVVAVANGLQEMIESPAASGEMGRRGKNYVENNLTRDTVAEKMIGELEHVLMEKAT